MHLGPTILNAVDTMSAEPQWQLMIVWSNVYDIYLLAVQLHIAYNVFVHEIYILQQIFVT